MYFKPEEFQISEARFTRYPGKPHRLFVCVHGMGGNGALDMDGYVEAAQSVMYGNVIFALPTFVEQGYSVCEGRSDTVMTEYIQRLHADPALQVSPATTAITGFSGGGQYTHRFVFRHPELFAAAAPISPGSWTHPDGTPFGMIVEDEKQQWGRYPEIVKGEEIRRPARPGIEKVKWFVACGQYDEGRLPSSRRFADALEILGADVRYSTFPLGHSLDLRFRTEIIRFLEECTPVEGQNRPVVQCLTLHRHCATERSTPTPGTGVG